METRQDVHTEIEFRGSIAGIADKKVGNILSGFGLHRFCCMNTRRMPMNQKWADLFFDNCILRDDHDLADEFCSSGLMCQILARVCITS
jgi:hypothetical protein